MKPRICSLLNYFQQSPKWVKLSQILTQNELKLPKRHQKLVDVSFANLDERNCWHCALLLCGKIARAHEESEFDWQYLLLLTFFVLISYFNENRRSVVFDCSEPSNLDMVPIWVTSRICLTDVDNSCLRRQTKLLMMQPISSTCSVWFRRSENTPR